MKRPRTPDELKRERGKDKISLYLDVRLVKEVKDVAGRAETSTSAVVNEAIEYYLNWLKSEKSDKKK